MPGEAWRAVLSELARTDAPEVLEEARAGARARARALLEDALVAEILRAVPPRPAAVAGNQTGEAWWVYGVVSSVGASDIATGLAGVEPGSAVEALEEGELAALASRVPLSEYGDDQLRLHLEDIEWLERTARAHEAVQERVLRRTDLVPLRLCTLYRDQDALRRVLRENAELFAENLALVQGCAEWGLKVFVDRVCQQADARAPSTPSSSGTDYLTGRQRERDLAAARDELLTRCAQEVHAAAAALARLERVNPVQHPEAHGRQAEMVLNGAYLLQRGQMAALQTRVDELNREWAPEGVIIELTGPWPPYNFVSESAGMMS
jgi:hypothetical protein